MDKKDSYEEEVAESSGYVSSLGKWTEVIIYVDYDLGKHSYIYVLTTVFYRWFHRPPQISTAGGTTISGAV